MLILSRILIKEWFKSLAGAVTVLFLLITTADLINGFLQGKDFSRVLLEYLLKMPDLMGKMLPICCLVASLFALNKLKAHSELISMLAAGLSYAKIYALIGSCAFFVVVVQFFNLGYLEPFANKVKRNEIQKSRKSEGKYLTRSSIEGGRFWYKTQRYFASFSYFDRKTNSLQDIELYFFNQNSLGEKILKASKATFKEKGFWEMTNVTELTLLDSKNFPHQRTLPRMDVLLEERLEDFGEFEADLTTLNYFKLSQFISRLGRTGINVIEYEILLLNKVFLSFICLVFALLPLSSVFNPNRRSSSFGKNVVQTLLVTVIFWVLYSSAVAMGNSGRLPPLVATSIVPLGFLFLVLWTFFKNRKLSS